MYKEITSKDLGLKLRELRKNNNLTLQEVGKRLNLTSQAIGYYEAGKRDLSFSLVIKFCNIYEAPISSLFSDNNEPFISNKSNKEINILFSDKVSKQAKDEILNFIDYIQHKYGYNKN